MEQLIAGIVVGLALALLIWRLFGGRRAQKSGCDACDERDCPAHAPMTATQAKERRCDDR